MRDLKDNRPASPGAMRCSSSKPKRSRGKENRGLGAANVKMLRRSALQKKLQNNSQSQPASPAAKTCTQRPDSLANRHSRPLADIAVAESPSSPRYNQEREPTSDEMDDVKARHSKIEASLHELESMAQAFKEGVDGVVGEFEALREELETLHGYYETLGVDYLTAIESVAEEKRTVAEYSGMLANAKIEIQLLEDALPDGVIPPNCAFSQARPW